MSIINNCEELANLNGVEKIDKQNIGLVYVKLHLILPLKRAIRIFLYGSRLFLERGDHHTESVDATSKVLDCRTKEPQLTLLCDDDLVCFRKTILQLDVFKICDDAFISRDM